MVEIVTVRSKIPKDEYEHDAQWYKETRDLCAGTIVAVSCVGQRFDWDTNTVKNLYRLVRKAGPVTCFLHRIMPFLCREAGSCGRHDVCRCGRIVCSEAL